MRYEVRPYLRSVIALLVLAVVAGVIFLPKMFLSTAEVTFVVNRQSPAILTGSHVHPETDEKYIEFVETQSVLMASEFVASAALRALKDRNPTLKVFRRNEKAADWLSNQLKTEIKGSLVTISLTLRDADEARKIVDAIARAYVEKVAFEHRRTKIEELAKLKARRRKLFDEVHGKLTQVAALTRKLEDKTEAGNARVFSPEAKCLTIEVDAMQGVFSLVSLVARIPRRH